MQFDVTDLMLSYFDGRCPLALCTSSPRLYALSENSFFRGGTPQQKSDLSVPRPHQSILEKGTERAEAVPGVPLLDPSTGAGLCVGHVVMYTVADAARTAQLEQMKVWPGEEDLLTPRQRPAAIPAPARVVHWYDLCPADAQGLAAVAWWWWADTDSCDALPVTLFAHCRSVAALLAALRATSARARRCIHSVQVVEAQGAAVEAALLAPDDAWSSSCDSLLRENAPPATTNTTTASLTVPPLGQLLELLPCARQAVLEPRRSSRLLLRHRRCLFELALQGNTLHEAPHAPQVGQQLTRLCLSDCNVRDIAAVQGLRHLEELDLSANAELLDDALLRGLSACRVLRRLNLSHCTQLSESPAVLVRAINALTFLDVSYTRFSTRAVSVVADVVDCALMYLNLFNCRCVQDVTPLRRLKRLRYLDVRLCPLELPTDVDGDTTHFHGPLECLLADAGVWASAPSVVAEVAPTLRCLTLEHVTGDVLEGLCAAGTAAGNLPLEQVRFSKSLDSLRLGRLGRFPHLQQMQCLAQTVQEGGLEGLDGADAITRVDLSRCDQLSDLTPVAKMPSLRRLSLICSDVTDTSLSTLATEGSGVEWLALCECAQLQDLSFLGVLECLTVLCVCGTGITDAAVAAIGARSRSLISLDLSNCPRVTRVGALGSIPTLEQLFLADVDLCGDGLEGLGARGTLRHLLMPRATRGRLMDWAAAVLPLCASLELLDVRGNMFHFSAAATVAPLWHDTARVTVIDLSECTSFSQLHLLASLPCLRALHASNTAVSDKDVHDFVQPAHLSPGARSLEELQLQNCIRLFSLNSLAACPALHTLFLSASNVQSDGMRELVRCRRLACIIADNCKGIHTVGFLGDLGALRLLDVRATNLTSNGLRGLERAPRLHSLLLSGCVGLVELAALAHLPRLHELHLANCGGITAESFAVVAAEAQTASPSCPPSFPRLCLLVLSHCTALAELPCDFLAALPYLQELYLEGTPALLRVPKSHALVSRIL